MCEYCEPSKHGICKPLASRYKGIYTPLVDIWKNENSSRSEILIHYDGEEPLELNIKFCPMCGRNLTETDSSIDAIDKLFPHMKERPKQTQITTKEELKVLHENCLYRMNTLLDMYDKEEAHIRADNILCEVLEKIGFHDVVNVFHKIDKWYA